MPDSFWRARYRPASFRGAPFKVDLASRAGGRRGQLYEYPNSERTKDEDLGRRGTRWAITGYTIGPEYALDADDLEEALKTPGAGLLIHPAMGEMDVRCETYTRSERRTEGGIATFDMAFVESRAVGRSSSPDTQQNVRDAAYAANVSAIEKTDSSVKAGPR